MKSNLIEVQIHPKLNEMVGHYSQYDQRQTIINTCTTYNNYCSSLVEAFYDLLKDHTNSTSYRKFKCLSEKIFDWYRSIVVFNGNPTLFPYDGSIVIGYSLLSTDQMVAIVYLYSKD